MPEDRRRRTSKRALLGNHQRCWIWGRNVVVETLRAGFWRPLEVRMAESLSGEHAAEVRELAAEQEIEIVVDTAADLKRACRSDEHQGLIARMPPFPYRTAEDVLRERSPAPSYVVLDAVQDPFNFGAILRSADVLGVEAVFIGTRGQTEVTSQVARSSAGAVNHVPIARVEEIGPLLARLKSLGVRIVGTSAEAPRVAFEEDFRGATAIVIGNEGFGIGEEAAARCDAFVGIPQAGRTESLNAAVAAGILLYEIRRQRMT